MRRTDHRVEAPFRELHEYMEHVKKWFESINHNGEKYVYIASDEPKVIEEAITKWTDYKVTILLFDIIVVKWLYYNNDGTISGAVKNNQNFQQDRSSMAGTLALFSDWYFLQRVDYLVGTSSSQVHKEFK